jgi:phosphoribosyl 1,2-cyclic phosphate phosphodiesterase
MKATFLGTGTSVGVPMIGCGCAVCRSTDPRNKRRRTSFYVEAGGVKLLVDTPPDFREQALTFGLARVDAVLFTHAHADHIFGFDDIRRFNLLQGGVIPAYGAAQTLEDLRRIFNYIGSDTEPGVYRPQIEFRLAAEPFRLGEVTVQPVPVTHGARAAQGYVFRCGGCSVCYIPDCRAIDDEVIAQIQGLDVMILDGLRHRPHSTHLTVAECLGYLRRIGARRSFMTHMCHDLDHEATERELPPDVRLAYDGLVLDW